MTSLLTSSIDAVFMSNNSIEVHYQALRGANIDIDSVELQHAAMDLWVRRIASDRCQHPDRCPIFFETLLERGNKDECLAFLRRMDRGQIDAVATYLSPL